MSRIKEWEKISWGGFFLDGTLPRVHQVENWEHYALSGGRHQIQDDTGLGKTLSALGQLKIHKESVPCLVLCKSSLAAQWALEIERKMGIIPQILRGKEQPDTKTFPIVICSLDLLRNTRQTWLKEQEEKKMFKSVIIDEIQLIKNGQASRTNAVRDFCKTVQFMTQLSGTPIENHAGEYFPSLNILAPSRYHTYEHFLRNNVGMYWDGARYKIGGLSDPQSFKERNKDILIRHRLEDVKGMPAVQREMRIVEISDRVQKAYDAAEAAFLAAVDEAEYGAGDGKTGFERAQNILAKMQILRHITGIAKIDASVEWISDFLETSDRKLAIYCHHNDVGEQLILKLNALCKEKGIDPPVSLIGTEASERQKTMQPFTEGQSRILIAKLLASGEGVDLHMCSDYLVTERHWNPKKEEQVEGRGTRLSSKFSTVFVTYLVGFQTIDEYMALLNEHKRHNVDKSIEGWAEAVSETDVFKKIAEMLKKRGKRAWRIA
jgi:Superfamily II DNA/RNA helicases, SNF2 family